MVVLFSPLYYNHPKFDGYVQVMFIQIWKNLETALYIWEVFVINWFLYIISIIASVELDSLKFQESKSLPVN